MGLLWVDPAAAIVGPLVPLSAPVGQATLRFSWPRDPGLHGQPLAFQALFADGTNLTASRFSNLVADRLVR